MNMNMLLSMSLPVEIFSTFHRYDNYYIDEMQYGDLSDVDFQRYAMSWEGSLAFKRRTTLVSTSTKKISLASFIKTFASFVSGLFCNGIAIMLVNLL